MRVCSVAGCPHLRPCPLPEHAPRDRNAPWSKDRDRKSQREFREAVLARDMFTCTRCGHHDVSGKTLVAHHDKPGYHVSAGRTLCTPCHKEIDTHAR